MCALLADGTAKCWGFNAAGNIGDGTTTTRLVPTTVVGLTGAVGIAGGVDVSCAIIGGSGTVKCWGDGRMVGDGTGVARLTPTTSVVGLKGVTHLAAEKRVCATLFNSTVACWGLGIFGDGSGPFSGPHLSPTVPHCLGNVKQTGAGLSLQCAVHLDGAVSCWGANSFGELGDGTKIDRDIPVVLPSFPGNGTGTSASCCSAHPGTGCNRQAVVSCVCGSDPFCCTNSWDGICAGEGNASACWGALCGDGIVQAGENCDDGNLLGGDGCDRNCRHEGFACVAHGTPDISDATTSACVCSTDSFCCNVAWDSACASEASSQCNACGSPCVVHETPGSSEPAVTNCVCARDSFCCAQRWDGICVSETSQFCGRACP